MLLGIVLGTRPGLKLENADGPNDGYFDGTTDGVVDGAVLGSVLLGMLLLWMMCHLVELHLAPHLAFVMVQL